MRGPCSEPMSRCPAAGLSQSSAIIWRGRCGEGEWRRQSVGGVTDGWPRSALRVPPPLPCVGFGLGAPDGTLRHAGQKTDLAVRLGGIFRDGASIWRLGGFRETSGDALTMLTWRNGSALTGSCMSSGWSRTRRTTRCREGSCSRRAHWEVGKECALTGLSV
jgi:hypothetical protein